VADDAGADDEVCVMASLQLLDDVASLLAAASRTKDRGARIVFIAEARIRVAAARTRVEELDGLTAAQEAEISRLERNARESA
jgi:hypothetical protein